MTDSLRHSISDIRDISPKLNAATDRASETVVRVEQFLNDECGIGLAAQCQVDAVQISEGKQRITYLSYARVGGKFRIAVETEIYCEFTNDQGFADQSWEQEDLKPWVNCPRDMKVEAFPMLPDLLEAVAEKAKKAVKAVEDSVAAVDKILAALE